MCFELEFLKICQNCGDCMSFSGGEKLTKTWRSPSQMGRVGRSVITFDKCSRMNSMACLLIYLN